jgi:uncharacterized membrane protein
MLKTHKRTLIITSIVILLPIIIGLVLWDRLPDVMATHFGADNEPNGFSSKPFAVFGLPLFLLAVHWLCVLFISVDPRRKNISPKLFSLILWMIPAISLFTAIPVYAVNLGHKLDITFFMMLFMGVLFTLIGNYLPKTRHNYTIGIRLPWTLDNEENWNRTHRLAGHIWMVCGILMIIFTLTGLIRAEWLIGVFIVTAWIPCVYSFWLHVRRGL